MTEEKLNEISTVKPAVQDNLCRNVHCL